MVGEHVNPLLPVLREETYTEKEIEMMKPKQKCIDGPTVVSIDIEVPVLSPETEAMLVKLCRENFHRRERGEARDNWFWADRVLLQSGYWFSERAKEDFPDLLGEQKG